MLLGPLHGLVQLHALYNSKGIFSLSLLFYFCLQSWLDIMANNIFDYPEDITIRLNWTEHSWSNIEGKSYWPNTKGDEKLFKLFKQSNISVLLDYFSYLLSYLLQSPSDFFIFLLFIFFLSSRTCSIIVLMCGMTVSSVFVTFLLKAYYFCKKSFTTSSAG